MPATLTAQKEHRLNLRTTKQQDTLLRRAAEATHRSMTEFVLDSAVTQAQQVLADRQWFPVDAEQFAEFQRLLDAPLPSFGRMFSRPSRFADQ